MLDAVGVLLAPLVAFAQSAPSGRVAVFFEEGFPTIDAPALSRAELEAALAPLGCRFLGIERTRETLTREDFDLLVLPFGSAVPKNAWEAIVEFLEQGGSLCIPGGAPLAVPVRREGTGWKVEVPQPSYARELGLGPPATIVGPDAAFASGSVAWAKGKVAGFEPGASWGRNSRAFAFDVRFSDRKDFLDQDGSSGPRDAVVRSLVAGRSGDGVEVVSAAIEIDRLRGRFAGGRWVFAPYEGPRSAELVRALVARALEGPHDLVIRPTLPIVDPPARSSFRVEYRRPRGSREGVPVSDPPAPSVSGEVALFRDGAPVERRPIELTGSGSLRVAAFDGLSAPGPPGAFVTAQVVAFDQSPVEGSTAGAWVARGFPEGPRIAVRGDGFVRGGKPFPVTGMTYMDSGVTRKFLFEPNPARWDADMSAMKAAGVNLIRTGLWNAWKTAMLDAGAPSETFLRSLDAFVLTAAKHDLPVIFTFFAFLPEAWGGENPFLDPRSVAAQREFVAAVARRYRGSPWVLYDFINEPSFSSAKHLWSTRPNGDEQEEAAWKEWLKRTNGVEEKGPDGKKRDASEAWGAVLERFRVSPVAGVGLPVPEDFDPWRHVLEKARPRKAAAYGRFAQVAFREWAAAMRETVRANAGPEALVTVGQDEGGLADRPHPLLHADAVDFTCMHTWWNNDDLLWDAVCAKAAGKPLLVEETGVMLLEGSDGENRRSPLEIRNLFERKLALSLAGRAAGSIVWVWNTDPYMSSNNEASIGIVRADGTAKPELAVFREFSAFVQRNAERLVDPEPDPVAVLLPHAGQYLPRSQALEASKRCVRTLAYRCGVGAEAASDLDPKGLEGRALIVVPSPGALARKGWEALEKAVRAGATALITGPFDADEDGLPAGRLGVLGLAGRVRAISREMRLALGNEAVDASFGGAKLERVDWLDLRGDAAGEIVLVEKPLGAGRFLLCPLPVELADDPDTTARVYREALRRAQIGAVEWPRGLFVRTLRFPQAVLFVLVNEGTETPKVGLGTDRAAEPIAIPPGRSAAVLLDRAMTEVIDRYPPSGR